MATFERISREEAQRLVMAPRRLVHSEYREYIRQLDENRAGRLELGEDEKAITIRARLRAAAKAEGREVEMQRRGRTIVVMIKPRER